MSETFDWRRVVRRGWPLIAAAALVAALVAVAFTLSARPTTVATTQVLCEQRLLAAYPGVPTADAVVSASRERIALQAIADRAGVPVARVDAALRLAPVAAPLYGVAVTVSSPDGDEAAAIARAAAEEAVVRARRLNAEQIRRYEQRVKLDEAAATVLDIARRSAPADPELAYKHWNVGLTLTDDEAAAATLRDAYRPVGGVVSARGSRVSEAARAALPALLAGAFLGLALAALRERFSPEG